MFLCAFFKKLPRKSKSLIIQGNLDKIISIERTELCFISVQMGNVGLESISKQNRTSSLEQEIHNKELS